MKTLELELRKRLLIVEGDIFEIPKYTQMWLNDKIKLMCKGSELTEYIVSDLVHSTNITKGGGEYYRDYCNIMGKELFFTALQSFISAIKAQGYYWAKNPYQDEWDELCEWGHGDFSKDGKSSFELYHEATVKTFNPNKTLIFQIL